MEIKDQKDNSLLNRKEVKFLVESVKNPSMEEARDFVCKEFKSDKGLTVIKGIKGKFGRNTFLVSAFIYNSKEDRDKTEPQVKGEGGVKEGEKLEEEKEEPTEEKKEAPVEEKKEEPKGEPTKEAEKVEEKVEDAGEVSA
ncbi:MAG: hypothetical protein ABIE22_01645 [archaeon]